MREKIIEKIGKVARGEIAAGNLPGSTTERMTIGLALNALEHTNPSFANDEEGAWRRLDPGQCEIVREFNPAYRTSKWTKLARLW
jgi:hypothetical protein